MSDDHEFNEQARRQGFAVGYKISHPYSLALPAPRPETRKTLFAPFEIRQKAIESTLCLVEAEKHWYLVISNKDRPLLRVRRLRVETARHIDSVGNQLIYCLGAGWLHAQRLQEDLTEGGRLAALMHLLVMGRKVNPDTGKITLSPAAETAEARLWDKLRPDCAKPYVAHNRESHMYELDRAAEFARAGKDYPGPEAGNVDPRRDQP